MRRRKKTIIQMTIRIKHLKLTVTHCEEPLKASLKRLSIESNIRVNMSTLLVKCSMQPTHLDAEVRDTLVSMHRDTINLHGKEVNVPCQLQ